MQLRTRIEGGGTKPLETWGVDSEYGTLRDVLIGPIDHFTWQPGNAVCQRAERVGLRFDFATARRQYGEMVDVYRQADVKVHSLAPDPTLPYQIFARDSSVMTPWGAIIMQMEKSYRRGEYAACLKFYLDAGIPIYDLVTAGNVEGGDFMVLKPGVAAWMNHDRCVLPGDRDDAGESRHFGEPQPFKFAAGLHMHGTDHERALPDGKCPHYLHSHRRTDEPRAASSTVKRTFRIRTAAPPRSRARGHIRAAQAKPTLAHPLCREELS